jgi:hypothetical protein
MHIILPFFQFFWHTIGQRMNRGRNMEEQPRLMSREHYIEMLIDSSFREAAEIEAGFMTWCERHAPMWRRLGHDEAWIRQRIVTARNSHQTHRQLKAQGLSMLAIRDALRLAYADHPELYDLALERERTQPGFLIYRGNTSDLRQRYTLRVLLYETDKQAYEKWCSVTDQPVFEEFHEQPESIRVVRDLSTVEELEMGLALSRYLLSLFDEPGASPQDQVAQRLEVYGKQLRSVFLSKQGYAPEESATPYIPVTIDGPQDHDSYYAKEYPA